MSFDASTADISSHLPGPHLTRSWHAFPCAVHHGPPLTAAAHSGLEPPPAGRSRRATQPPSLVQHRSQQTRHHSPEPPPAFVFTSPILITPGGCPPTTVGRLASHGRPGGQTRTSRSQRHASRSSEKTARRPNANRFKRPQRSRTARSPTDLPAAVARHEPGEWQPNPPNLRSRSVSSRRQMLHPEPPIWSAFRSGFP